jgi:hypothetical protein
LHAVDPNRLICRVSAEPHRVQRTDSLTGTGPSPCPPPPEGGAMPAWRSFRLPPPVSQSVVQGGESTLRTVTSCQP